MLNQPCLITGSYSFPVSRKQAAIRLLKDDVIVYIYFVITAMVDENMPSFSRIFFFKVQLYALWSVLPRT